MGSVWLAHHLTLNSWVAVKLMDPSIASTIEGAERFKREAQAAASLRSAHVVQVLDYGVHECTPFLVMELLQGQSLAECLEREKRLTPERALAIITQVARAMGRAHAGGIVHRDLKPDNIFLVREDDQELAKVLDFGIAKTTGPQLGGLETRTGVTMGTPYYMSPEQLEGRKALDHRSDLWSLAVITCECLSGLRPFDGETYGELLLNICARPVPLPSRQGFILPGFDEWFAKGANRDPEQRFGSAQELAAALGDVVAGRVKPVPLTAPPATGPDRTLPMDSPALPLSGSQTAQPMATRATTAPAEAAIHARPTPPPAAIRSHLVALVVSIGVAMILALVLVVVLLLRRSAGSDHPPMAEPMPIAGPITAPLQLNPDVPETAATTAPVKITPRGASNDHTAPPPLAISALPTVPGLVSAPPVRPVTSTPPSAAKSARCYSDPFTGQLRVADDAHASSSFACRQNPFTGAYQKQ